MEVLPEVLIVGGGVAGLTASVFLARQGVRATLVERHPGTSIYPRARGVNGRTMELMRELGLEQAIRARGERLAPSMGIYSGTTLVQVLEKRGDGGWIGRWLRRRAVAGRGSKKSPTSAARITQDDLEPLLLDAARAAGVEALFYTEAIDVRQDGAGVTATLVDRQSGDRREVRATYLIAADGARSPLRTALGIGVSGPGVLSHQLNVYFRADLAALVKGREFSMCTVENADVRGMFASVNNTDLWVFHIPFDPERGERPEDFTADRCVALIRKAVGMPALDVEVKGVSPWQSSVRVADTFRRGRVFLAGDAAHIMPPWGGFGANTAMQDAHNLAWKLAAVLKGRAGPALLDTYEAERRPLALTVSALAGSLNDERGLMSTRGGLRIFWTMRKVFPYMVVGYGYESAAIVSEPGAPAAGPGTTDLRGRPGTRAPHVWLSRDGTRISTLDLFGRGFVLVAGRDGTGWIDAAHRLHIDSVRIGTDVEDPDNRWHDANGVTTTGAILVRPDGFIAWRAKSAHAAPDDALQRALTGVLCRATALAA